MNKLKKSSGKTSIFQQTEFTLGLIIVILFVAASFLTDNFCTKYNITNLMKQGSIIGVMAAAQTMVIITGGIDISGGAVAGLSCMILALLQRDTGINFYLTLLISLLLSVAIGFINGVIVYDLRVPPMITTLGMQTIVRGIVKIISNGLTVTGIDQRILNMGNSNLGGVLPTLTIIWIIVLVVIWFILKYTIFGRNLYVLGSGVEVARLSGIKVKRMFYKTYAFAGLLYGIAGIMLAARVQSALPGGGEGYDMNAIAAAVIGGASLSGGKGAITGTLLGTVLMQLINNAGVQFGLNTHVLEITSGVLIIFAVTMDMLKNRKKA